MATEVIPTGLTPNYVSYWTVTQAIKEAAQNIAYGAIKSGSKPVLKYDEGTGMGLMQDDYIGLKKRHLYIGESEQKDDEDGIGNFGEGWKLFLLVMAREKRFHRIDTVGFSFYGKIEPTPHNTEVLNIYVEPNERIKGTLVTIECTEEEFSNAINSFAVLTGINEKYIREETIIPNRFHELWINGVRIEQEDNTNPLNLYFAYNLKDRSLINRDRSQVNVDKTYSRIRRLIFRQGPAFIKKYVDLALEGQTYHDIMYGFYNDLTDDKQSELWLKIIAKAHKTRGNRLVIPSNNHHIDREAEYRGYTLIRLPRPWYSELRYLGFKSAEEVIKLEVKHERAHLNEREASMLKSVKMRLKHALGLRSIKDFPKIVVVEYLTDDNVVSYAEGVWDKEKKTIFLAKSAFSSERKLARVLLHETNHWLTDAGDLTTRFLEGYEDAILRLLGY